MTRMRQVLVFLFTCGVTLTSSTFADEIKLAADDYALLIGVWEGTFSSKSPDGKVLFSTNTQLTIVEDGLGKFWLKKNDQMWVTTVGIEDGKIILRIGHAERPFVYEEEDDRATLSVYYDSEFEGHPRKYSLVLIQNRPNDL